MNLPDHINGPSVTLRLGKDVDPNSLFNLVIASKAEVVAFLPWAEKYASVQDAAASITRFKTLWDDGIAYTYAIYNLDNILVGMVDWRPKADWWGTIGYWLGTAYTGHGYMTAAVNQLVEELFKEGVHRAVIQCDPKNSSSAAVAKRAGFTFEGQIRQDRKRPDGAFHDSLQFSRLACDPKPVLLRS
jgi:RimJ/RimL family protein N-acetyltransferase